MKTTVFLFHPKMRQSRVNAALANSLDDDIEVRDLYALYPDFKIDVAKEQDALAAADRVVLQFPMYWYSSPALLKQWEDKVLEYGWAYGTGGTALHGKELVLAVSPGADNYGREKFAKYTVHELLRPLQAMSRLVGMDFKVPFITVGASSIGKAEIAQQAKKYDTYLHETALPTLGDFD